MNENQYNNFPISEVRVWLSSDCSVILQDSKNQRTNGPVNAHLISWPSKAQNIQNLKKIW